MNILTPNRGRIGQAVSNTFDKVLSSISAVWLVEHNDDGTHGDVTAESLTVSGDASFTDGISVTGIADDVGDGNDGIFSEWNILVERSALVSETDVSITALNDDTTIPSGQAVVQAIVGSNGASLTANSTESRVDAENFYDQGRTTAMGNWTTFTPTRTASAGTWTVGTISTAAYMLVGKTMTVAFYFTGTSVSNAGVTLAITIPASATAAKAMAGPCIVKDAGGAYATGNWDVQAAGTAITLYNAPGYGTFGSATTNTDTIGVASFEIQ